MREGEATSQDDGGGDQLSFAKDVVHGGSERCEVDVVMRCDSLPVDV